MTEKQVVLGAGKKVRQVSTQGTEQDETAGNPTSETYKEARAGLEQKADKLRARKESNRKPVTVQVFTLAGVTHSGYNFEDLAVGQEVFLVPDPFGQVVKPKEGHPDPTAVSVQDMAGTHIGYLKSTIAQVVFKAVNSGAYEHQGTVVDVKGGYKGAGGEKLNWGVDIEVKFFKKED